MKYVIDCPKCGDKYEISIVRSTPKFCTKCGGALPEIKTEARISAEAVMATLPDLKERMDAAWEAYFALKVEYDNEVRKLTCYKLRGVITPEEMEPYMTRKQKRPGQAEALKEYRASLRKAKEEATE